MLVWNGILLSSPISWHQIVILPFFRQKTPLGFFTRVFSAWHLCIMQLPNAICNGGNPTKYYTIHQHNIIPRTECHCLICIFVIQNQLVRSMLLIAYTRTSDIALQHNINSSWTISAQDMLVLLYSFTSTSFTAMLKLISNISPYLNVQGISGNSRTKQ